MPFAEDTVFSPVCNSGFLIKNRLSIGVCIYVWVFILIPLINGLFFAKYHAYIAISLQYDLKFGMVIPTAVLLLFNIVGLF